MLPRPRYAVVPQLPRRFSLRCRQHPIGREPLLQSWTMNLRAGELRGGCLRSPGIFSPSLLGQDGQTQPPSRLLPPCRRRSRRSVGRNLLSGSSLSMECRRLGTSEIEVSTVGLGNWQVLDVRGQRRRRMPRGIPRPRSGYKTLRRFPDVRRGGEGFGRRVGEAWPRRGDRGHEGLDLGRSRSAVTDLTRSRLHPRSCRAPPSS